MSSKRGLVFLAWTQVGDRAREISGALGGTSFVVFPFNGFSSLGKIFRYLFSAFHTLFYLVKNRPSFLIVTSPPVFCALLGFFYSKFFGATFILDCHPGGFGLQGDVFSRRLLPITRFIIRHAELTLVAESGLASLVESWGGRSLIFHEAPPCSAFEPAHEPEASLISSGIFTVLLVSVFQRDEPVHLAIEAVRGAAWVNLQITGDLKKAPKGLVAGAPDNVKFLGYLGAHDYRLALRSADAVLVLTDDDSSVVRAGYDAVWERRPLILSNTAVLNSAFPYANFVENSQGSIFRGIEDIFCAYEMSSKKCVLAADDALLRAQLQLNSFREFLVSRGYNW